MFDDSDANVLPSAASFVMYSISEYLKGNYFFEFPFFRRESVFDGVLNLRSAN